MASRTIVLKELILLKHHYYKFIHGWLLYIQCSSINPALVSTASNNVPRLPLIALPLPSHPQPATSARIFLNSLVNV